MRVEIRIDDIENDDSVLILASTPREDLIDVIVGEQSLTITVSAEDMRKALRILGTK